MKILCFGLCALFFFTGCRQTIPDTDIAEMSISAAQNSVGVTDWKLPSKATHGGQADGRVYFVTYHSGRKARIKHCVLQHGYGVTQSAIDNAIKVRDFQRFFQKSFTTLHTFGSVYFGAHLVDDLLQGPCENVTVAAQESNNSTILEMTRRTERFLVSEGFCSTRSCALYGHSKGGAVVYNIARRCMEQSSDSKMGAKACQNIKEVYSATGVVQGASAPALILGAKTLKNQNQSLDECRFVTEAFQGLSTLYAKTLLKAGGLAWDLDSDKTSKTNPTWFDLSPTAPQEYGRPLYLANSVPLEKRGWLTADFAASATKHRFDGRLSEGLGCGDLGPAPREPDRYATWLLQKELCTKFGNSLGMIHGDTLKFVFEEGAREMKRVADSLDQQSDYLEDVFSWDSFQVGDGFADYDLALASCKRSLNAPKSAAQSCYTFSGLNHQATAGGAKNARNHAIAQFSH